MGKPSTWLPIQRPVQRGLHLLKCSTKYISIRKIIWSQSHTIRALGSFISRPQETTAQQDILKSLGKPSTWLSIKWPGQKGLCLLARLKYEPGTLNLLNNWLCSIAYFNYILSGTIYCIIMYFISKWRFNIYCAGRKTQLHEIYVYIYELAVEQERCNIHRSIIIWCFRK